MAGNSKHSQELELRFWAVWLWRVGWIGGVLVVVVHSRRSQYVYNFRFFNIFISLLTSQSPETSKFLKILAKIASGNWITSICEFFSTALWRSHKRSRANSLQLGLQNITSLYSKKVLLLNYYTSKILIFTCLQKCQKSPKT